jgi:type IV secretory pathway TraG/TraD family ATPase VirD4
MKYSDSVLRQEWQNTVSSIVLSLWTHFITCMILLLIFIICVLLQVWVQNICECSNLHDANSWCRGKIKHIHLIQSHKNKGNLRQSSVVSAPRY